MLLTVADTPQEVEKTRKAFTNYYYFTYCATKEDMLSTAMKYSPSTVLLRIKAFTEPLKNDLKKLYENFPDIQLVIVCDDTDHGISCAKQVPYRTKFFHILYHVLYYSPRIPASIKKLKENLIVCGFFFNTYFSQIRLYGFSCPALTKNDGTLLRFLAEHHPHPVSAEKIAECFFGYGKRVTLNAVSARISRLNKHCIQWCNTHDVVKHIRGQGYKIDF